MMILHSTEHEDVLHDLVSGDMEPDDPRAKEVLDLCHECRRKLEDLRALAALLEETAREERELLAAVEPGGSAPGAERIAPFVRARAAEARAKGLRRPTPRPTARALSRKPWRSAVQLAAAAAAVLALAWLARVLLPEPGSQGRTRLGTRSSAMVPSGPVADFERFTWTFARPPGGWYQLVVWHGEPGPNAPLFETTEHLTEPRWTPSPEIRASWPQAIRWQVIVRDATGSTLGVHEASARRSSR